MPAGSSHSLLPASHPQRDTITQWSTMRPVVVSCSLVAMMGNCAMTPGNGMELVGFRYSQLACRHLRGVDIQWRTTRNAGALSYSVVTMGICEMIRGNGTEFQWRQMGSMGTPPSERYWPAMAYDSTRGRTVLFGGFDGGKRGDTWEWDGTQWIRIASSELSPPARHWHTLTYDVARGRAILFGGDDGERRNDVWEWDGCKLGTSVSGGRLTICKRQARNGL